MDFDDWIQRLTEDVIQGEYGYEPGEFSVFPELWKRYFDRGMSPEDAFRRALDAHKEGRREDEAAKKANWERIQAEDAKIPKGGR